MPRMDTVGERIRAARQSRGLSVRQLAADSGCSASSISQIERGVTTPRTRTLVALATSLGMTVAQLLSDDQSLHLPLRREDRREIRFGSLRREYPLTRRPRSSLEVYIVALDPGGTSDRSQVTHGDSDEFLLVLSGADLRFETNVEQHQLRVGDSMEWRSSVPHWVVNDGDIPAELVWAISPPTPVPHLGSAASDAGA